MSVWGILPSCKSDVQFIILFYIWWIRIVFLCKLGVRVMGLFNIRCIKILSPCKSDVRFILQVYIQCVRILFLCDPDVWYIWLISLCKSDKASAPKSPRWCMQSTQGTYRNGNGKYTKNIQEWSCGVHGKHTGMVMRSTRGTYRNGHAEYTGNIQEW